MSDGEDLPIAPDEESTGVPLLRRWDAVYAVVLGAFIVCVVLLTWFTMHFTRVTP